MNQQVKRYRGDFLRNDLVDNNDEPQFKQMKRLDLSKLGKDAQVQCHSNRYAPKTIHVQEFMDKEYKECSKVEEIVKKRINPHYITEQVDLTIPDLSLIALKLKNGDIPLSPTEAKEAFASKFRKSKKEKDFSEMDEAQKETYFMIRDLRYKNKASYLYSQMQTYMKEEKENQRLRTFAG